MASRKLPFMMKGSASGVRILSDGTIMPNATLPIITKPITYTKKILRIKAAIEKKAAAKTRQKEYLQKQKVIISCKNPALNFHQGQTYGKFEQIPLASLGWRNRKTNGDSFFINKTSKNPAILDDDLKFADMELCSDIVGSLEGLNLTRPTNIQSLAAPVIMEGKNTLIAAETGNGKTFAYLLPIMQQLIELKENQIVQDRPCNSPLLLVVVPGRELAVQIENMCKPIASSVSLNVESVVGAERTKQKIINPKMTHPDVLIATVGVLSKLITAGVLKTQSIRHVVLDEADTLLDDSFSDKMSYILKRIPIRCSEDPLSGAQLILAGATMPTSLDDKLKDIVEMKSVERLSTTCLHRLSPHVTQRFYRMSVSNKIEATLDMVREAHKKNRPTIVFGNTTDTVNWLGHIFKENDIDCVHITKKLHSATKKILYNKFMNGGTNVISCTDFLSRGLDTSTAQHVINYDFPKFTSDYIHRCGRVGRIGSNFNAPLITNFISRPEEAELLHTIEYAVRRSEELPDVNANIKRLYKDEKERYEKLSAYREYKKYERQVKKADRQASRRDEKDNEEESLRDPFGT